MSEAQVWDETGTDYYVPLVSNEWREGDSIAVVMLAISKQWVRLKISQGRTEGLIDPSGIPARVRARWSSLNSGTCGLTSGSGLGQSCTVPLQSAVKTANLSTIASSLHIIQVGINPTIMERQFLLH